MIFIAGIPSESTIQLVTQAAEKLGVITVIFNQRKAHQYELITELKKNKYKASININGTAYDLEKMKGMYYRMMDANYLPEVKDKVFNYIGDKQLLRLRTIHEELGKWIYMTKIRILNYPPDTYSNISKPYQSQLIRRSGFEIPPTCITSDVDAVKRFEKEQDHLIYKSISSSRSIVKELFPKHEEQLKKIRYLPTQFQQKLEGNNIRVHVVGDVLFATKIKTDGIDYRYAARDEKDLTMQSVKLSRSIEKKCFRLASDLRLPLCGIDLFQTKTNKYYCFEVNPSPGYSYFQENDGQDIATAIVKWLEFGTAK